MPSIFICYSHKNKAWRDKLLEHLGTLNLEDKEVWSDLDLEAGDIWDKTIKEVLSQVKAVVLLISPSFLNSKYILNSELPVLLKRREQEGVRIIPLFVRASVVETVPFKYTNDLGKEITFYLNEFQSPPNNSPSQPLSKLTSSKKDDVLVSVAKSLYKLIEEQKKKIEQNNVLSRLNQANNPTLPDFINKSSLNFDDSLVYLSIELETESLKTNKNESEKFSLNTWLAIPESPQSYQYINLLKIFEPNRSYSQAEIEENFSKLITECNEELEKIKPNEEFDIAIEWILPSNLLSLNIDRWNYRENTTIACGPFRSVHVRSSQRLHTDYKHCRIKWKKKWEHLLNNLQQLNLSHYLLACQCNSKSENDLKIFDNQKEIVGINLPSDLQELENFSYEFVIETGIPLALWSRCKQSNTNHITDLDTLINPNQENTLINPNQENTLNLQNLPQSIQNKRLEANPNQPNHLGHHLCFLWENPYNYPKQKKLRFN